MRPAVKTQAPEAFISSRTAPTSRMIAPSTSGAGIGPSGWITLSRYCGMESSLVWWREESFLAHHLYERAGGQSTLPSNLLVRALSASAGFVLTEAGPANIFPFPG